MSIGVQINLQTLQGFTGVSISRALDNLAGTFEIKAAVHAGLESTRRTFQLGDKITITDQQQAKVKTLFTGYIETLSESYTGDSHEITITGRDKTADLIDCTAAQKPSELKNQTILQFATELLKPFDISASAAVEVGAAFDSLPINATDTIYATIDTYAKQRGLLMQTTPEGNLIFFKIGTNRAPTVLNLGKNIKELSYSENASRLFSEYTVIGQKAKKTGAEKISAIRAPRAGVTDELINRHRPLTISSTAPIDQNGCEIRAKYERGIRRGRAFNAAVEVTSWTPDFGNYYYSVGDVIELYAPAMGIDGDVLITGVQFTANSDGINAALSLSRAGAYTTEPQTAATKTAKNKGVNWRPITDANGKIIIYNE